MSQTVLIIPSRSRALKYLPDLQDFCATLSTFVQEDVALWTVDEDEWAAAQERTPSIKRLEAMDHHGDPIVAAPMAAAPFKFLDNGRPDWSSMWKGFCELALYGGPPHRGPDSALAGSQSKPNQIIQDEMIEEIIRGIQETTGLVATPAPGGWLRIECDSKRMAAWLCATIIIENVDARVENTFLFVPGDEGFELKDQVKSVITVVAKTHHYWLEHLANESGESATRAKARAILEGQNLPALQKAG